VTVQFVTTGQLDKFIPNKTDIRGVEE